MFEPTLPPPGWYADPAGSYSERWWDGQRWSGDVRPAPTTSPAGSLPSNGQYSAGWPVGPDGAAPAAVAPARVIPLRAAWWALLGILVGEIVGGIVAEIVSSATGTSLTGAAATLAGELGLWGGMIGSCLVVSRRYGTGSLARDFTLGFKPRDLLYGPAAAVVGVIVTTIVTAAFAGTRFAGSNTQILSGEKGDGVGFTVVALIVALGAPFFEELFFRGLLRTVLAARLGPIGAIWGQAVLFGLAHYEAGNGLGNISVMVAIGAFGVVLGYTARLTGRLGAGMIAHSLFNLVAAIAILTG